MIKRLITTIVGLPLVILIVHHGGLPLLLMCTILSLMGLRELYVAFSKSDKPVHIVGYVFTVVYFAAVFAFGAGHWLLIALTLFIICVQTLLVVLFNRLALEDIVVTVYGFLYVPFLISFIVLVRDHPLGQLYIWLIFISAFGCDTFAYLAGVNFGRHKLKNSPSPVKSVEGIIGGVLGATLLGLTYGFFVVRFADPEATVNFVLFATVISFFGAAFCIVGDMAASAIKRRTGVKDFGSLLPGHGGVLDRADSVIIVAPIVYLVMSVLMRVVGHPWMV
ncbi:MAG: phosphatidate cytidylyltransferase [Defluviitaleaceae bacterium]|nr:phosphatidate cytidylyltransferase [Defluviitaleaceae bacterium]